jgi:hypothetical protein
MLRIIRPEETAKLQWLQDPSEINGDNLKNVRRETSRHFRNKKREYPKDKINELATNNSTKNITDLYRGSIFVKEENGDLLVDSNNMLSRWKSYFSQLLNVHNVGDVRRRYSTAEPLVHGPRD